MGGVRAACLCLTVCKDNYKGGLVHRKPYKHFVLGSAVIAWCGYEHLFPTR